VRDDLLLLEIIPDPAGPVNAKCVADSLRFASWRL
jgi:hypothetical protein